MKTIACLLSLFALFLPAINISAQPPKSLSSIAIDGPVKIAENTSATYKATAIFSNGAKEIVTTKATWSEDSLYATINNAGGISIADVPADQKVNITAKYTYSGVTKSATISITISNIPPYFIFVGIWGGGLGDLYDGSKSIVTKADSELTSLIANSGLKNPSTNLVDLRKISQINTLGGLVANAFFVNKTFQSRSSINGPGNTKVLRQDIEKNYNKNKNVKIVLAGHSAGGGDVQNLLQSLKTLGIPVELSGHIDSVEILGVDAKIPSNTKRAMGFYQKDGSKLTQGEDELIAEDKKKTEISNTRVVKAQGPSLPNGPDGKAGTKDDNTHAYHQNMDNDERVWKAIYDYVIGQLSK